MRRVCIESSGFLLQKPVVEYVPRQAAAPKESADAISVSRLLSELGHELRTPLNAILGFAQLLELAPPPADDQQRAHAAQIRRAGLYMLDLIDETLDLSRVEAGVLELNQHAVELASIIDAALPFVAPPARDADDAHRGGGRPHHGRRSAPDRAR